MDKIISYGVIGVFLGTAASLFLNQYQSNPFLLFLLPMWGMVLSIAVARVINLHEIPDEAKSLKN